MHERLRNTAGALLCYQHIDPLLNFECLATILFETVKKCARADMCRCGGEGGSVCMCVSMSVCLYERE